jgi:hypothetical protein
MKRILSILLMACFAIVTFAQVPQSFKYQAVVRDAQGNPLANKTVSLRIGILAGSFDGQATYSETHQTATNAFGLVNLEIGKGAPKTGAFAAIDWSLGNYFVKVECDPDGGSNYALLGTSQLLSVPYALYAEKSGNGFSGDYNDLQNKPDLAKYLTTDDMTPSGIPKLRVSQQGDTLSLGKDNYVFVPGISRYNYANRPELIEFGITDVKRNTDGDVEITFAYKVRSTGKPEYYWNSDNPGTLYNSRYSVNYDQRQESEFVSVGEGLWQSTAVYSYRDSRYLPGGTWRVWAPDIRAPACTTYMAPCEVAIPGGEKPAPKPVITDVSIDRGVLKVSYNGIGLSYITYTQTEPGKAPENKKTDDTSIGLNESPTGTIFSNFRITDMFGQTSDAWSGTVTTPSRENRILSFKVNGVEYQIQENENYGIITHIYPQTGPYEWGNIPAWPVAPEIVISDKATIEPAHAQ